MTHDAPIRKLTAEQVEEIRRLYQEGQSIRQIAAHFPELVHAETVIHNIVQYRRWKEPESDPDNKETP
jgi:transposase